MPAKLHVKGGGQDREYSCEQITTIGRSKSNDIQLVDPKVSRSHALVRCLGDGNYYLMDMGSSNGSAVNNNRIFVPSILNDGDVIGIGNHELEFRREPEEGETNDSGDDSEYTNPTMLTVGGVIHKVTVLVTDVRGYTPMSERLSVDSLANVMSTWFRGSNEIVGRNSGVIDKFIGDAIMARWTHEKNDHRSAVISALRVAQELNLEAAKINTEFPELPYPFRIGVGINTGEAVLGNVGGNSRRDFTALGDSVNLAFRLETATKDLKKDVVLGPDSFAQLDAGLCSPNMSSVQVKGKDTPVKVCALKFEEIDAYLG